MIDVSSSFWYFPGDPAVPDFLVETASVLASGGLGIYLFFILLIRTFRSRIKEAADLRGFLLALMIIDVILCVFMAVPGVAAISYRHGAEWQQVRSAIADYSSRIQMAAGDPQGLLKDDEFQKLRQQILPVPVELRFPHAEATVLLYMASYGYPYVKVDFGKGATAEFHPKSMFCTYSD